MVCVIVASDDRGNCHQCPLFVCCLSLLAAALRDLLPLVTSSLAANYGDTAPWSLVTTIVPAPPVSPQDGWGQLQSTSCHHPPPPAARLLLPLTLCRDDKTHIHMAQSPIFPGSLPHSRNTGWGRIWSLHHHTGATYTPGPHCIFKVHAKIIIQNLYDT